MAPTCFISYSWDTEEHRDWVRTLAESLQRNGVTAYLDQWDVYPGADLTKYMETRIRESEYVILVCSPLFAQKANTRSGGVGYEQAVVTGELFKGVASPRKFVPILRKGTQEESLPSYLKSRVYVDFRNDDAFNEGLESLLRHLHTSPKYSRPPLGPRPTLEAGDASGDQHGTSRTIRDLNQQHSIEQPIRPLDLEKLKIQLEKLKRLADLVRVPLELSQDKAKKWAETHLDHFENIDLAEVEEQYEKFCEFAYSHDHKHGYGLGMSHKEARAWAFSQVEHFPNRSFESFKSLFVDLYHLVSSDFRIVYGPDASKWALDHIEVLADRDLVAFAARYAELYDFAASTEGLGMRYAEAEAWALEKALQECITLPSYRIKKKDDSKPGRLRKFVNHFRKHE